MTESASGPTNIVLIHGLWMTALSWEHWVERYQARGFNVIARSWPGMEGDIEALRKDPSALGNLSIEDVIDHYTKIIEDLDSPPIIMGHSFGGLFTQILIDRGMGAAGVAIDSAPVKGILLLPFSTLRVSFPALSNPFNFHHAEPLTEEQFRYAFGNNLSEADSKAAYERYAVPGPDHVLFQGALANFNPHSPAAVDFGNNDRSPLFLIAGGKDHIAPASITKTNYDLYAKSLAVTAYKEFPERSHWTCAEPGWEDVADTALDWAVQNDITRVNKRSAF